MYWHVAVLKKWIAEPRCFARRPNSQLSRHPNWLGDLWLDILCADAFSHETRANPQVVAWGFHQYFARSFNLLLSSSLYSDGLEMELKGS